MQLSKVVTACSSSQHASPLLELTYNTRPERDGNLKAWHLRHQHKDK